MIRHNRLSFRLVFGAVLAAGLLTVVSVPAGGEELSPQQEIAKLEREIQAMRLRLEELRRVAVPAPAKAPDGIPADWVKALHWRSIGPASMGGRIVALSVFEADPSTYWVATASGGLLKTENNGNTFEHQFDRESSVSIGDVCVAPSDRKIVWVGTGENNPRNSVSYGDGVYKSTDGGKTWKNMGLKKTFQIGKVIVHPTDPNTVYVGALGRLYGPSKERGVYKTIDGGKTWHRVFYIDDRTGVIDMRMHPAEPETLLVAMWERHRDEFDSHRGEPPLKEGYDAYDPDVKWGKSGGIFKTTNGGKSFHKLAKGLPTSMLGRIGLDWYRKDPGVIFAIIDCEKIGMGPPPNPVFMGIQGEDTPGIGAKAPPAAKLTSVSSDTPAAKAGLKDGDMVTAVDKKPIKGYAGLVAEILKRKPGDKLPLTIRRDKKTLEITVTLGKRPGSEGPPGRGRGRGIGFQTEDIPGGGVRVSRVPPDGPAAKAGLKAGDILETLDKKKVANRRDLLERLRAHNPGDPITFKVIRGKASKTVTMTLPRRPGQGGQNPRRPYSFSYGGQRPNVQQQQGPKGYEYGGVYRSGDGGETWTRINSINPRPMYFSQVRVDPSDEKYVYVCGISLFRSSDGGKTFTADGGRSVHPDQHALWIDPKDGRHMVIGCDGGFYDTYDRMNNWNFLNKMAIGQFYHVAVDTRRPYRAYGGLQDNGSWGGPAHTLDGRGPVNADWVMVSGGDGFVCQVDPNDPDLVYFESQDGHMGRRNLRTGEYDGIRPKPVKGLSPYRFNWNTPFILSGHNSRIFYAGGNYVFRSVQEGEDLRPISQEITRTKRGSATALAESPRNPDVLWAGTDDGYLWVTQDGGKNWANVTEKVGLPGPRWVASIEASRFKEGRAYVVFDAHRSNDDEPYVYVTEDYGQSWKSIRANLPSGSTRVLREDRTNENLLYLGTEFAVWATIDRGTAWAKINGNLPTVAVHELAQHPTAGEMVAATHGRSLWVLDVTPLRQMTAQALQARATLFRPATATRWRSEPTRGVPYGAGNGRFVGENPPRGAQIYYTLTKKASKMQLRVLDYTGTVVRELAAKGDPGLHRIAWDLISAPQARPAGGILGGRNVYIPFNAGGLISTILSARPQPPRQGPRRIAFAAPGMYQVVLTVDGKEHRQGLRVENDPALRNPTLVVDEEEDEEEREMKRESKRIDDY